MKKAEESEILPSSEEPRNNPFQAQNFTAEISTDAIARLYDKIREDRTTRDIDISL
jgi:hypothetical protein